MAADRSLSAACTFTASRTGLPAVHPIRGDLFVLRRDYPKDAYVFVPGAAANHSTVSSSASAAAKMPFPIHPPCCAMPVVLSSPMMMANDTRALQHYLGHRNIQHTVQYTDMAPD